MYGEVRVPLRDDGSNYMAIGINPETFHITLRLCDNYGHFTPISLDQLFTFFTLIREAVEWSGPPGLLMDDETKARFLKVSDELWLVDFNHTHLYILDTCLKKLLQMQDTIARHCFGMEPARYEHIFVKYAQLIKHEDLQPVDLIERLGLDMSTLSINSFEYKFLFDTVTKLYDFFVSALFG